MNPSGRERISNVMDAGTFRAFFEPEYFVEPYPDPRS
jgi:hypothetical protein